MKPHLIFTMFIGFICQAAFAFDGDYPDLKTVPLPSATLAKNFKWCMQAQNHEEETARYFSFWKSCVYAGDQPKKMDRETLRYARLAAYRLVVLRYEYAKKDMDGYQFVEWLANTDAAIQPWEELKSG